MAEAIRRQSGETIDYTPGSAVDANTIVEIQKVVGVVVNDIAASTKGALAIEGVYGFPKVSTATTYAKGTVVYWDNDNSYATATAAGNTRLGIVADASSATDTTVNVKLTPGSTDETAATTTIHVTKDGSAGGSGSITDPMLTITAALAAVTATRKTIMLGPDTYNEAAALVWPTGVSGVNLIGVGNRWETVIGQPTAGDQVIDVTPGVQAATFELTIQNIQIDHDTSGLDGLDLDNTGMTKKLNVYLGNVGFTGGASDKSIVTLQGDTSNAIRIYWDGQNGDCEGDVYLDAGNDGNRFYAKNVYFGAGMETAADAVAFQIQLEYCGVLHEGVTGGNAAQTITTVGCYSKTGTTFAALDTADLAGSHSESIISV